MTNIRPGFTSRFFKYRLTRFSSVQLCAHSTRGGFLAEADVYCRIDNEEPVSPFEFEIPLEV